MDIDILNELLEETINCAIENKIQLRIDHHELLIELPRSKTIWFILDESRHFDFPLRALTTRPAN